MFLNLSDTTAADDNEPKLTDLRLPRMPNLAFRFSLKSLMVAVTVTAALLGGVVAYRNWRNELPLRAVGPEACSRPLLCGRVNSRHPLLASQQVAPERSCAFGKICGLGWMSGCCPMSSSRACASAVPGSA
jgi:hypothetical protein